ncbi:MAG: MBL fold metallo-hydrolase [Desulfarculaceae bacterium]|nr:MBL fold metallo-hydrolase [Desulfarculaceae bacterium]MCF8072746.1 MBL fold metallo-hydrolase [Desulfarculaceae bacterium]MCF8100914.1 MBL fold metallo-hydrolase [Desulfarculaceae bacterium]MCF8118564.1 MBL fold metallo-hydrolase [Desulfarculaceae bacterium]
MPLDQLPPIDAVVISHDHYDHLDYATVRDLGERVPVYIVPLGVGAHLESWGVARERIVERDWWGEVKLNGLTFTATPARHFSGRSLFLRDREKTLWCGWAVAGPEHRVFYSGDTGMFPGFAQIANRLGPFDAVIMEIGAYSRMWPDVHIGPEQAVQARLDLGSGLLIPAHWGTFNLAMHSWTEPVERLLAAAAKAGVAVVVPRPGQSVEPADPPQPVRWWPALPWRSAEEALLVSTGLGQPSPPAN